MIKNEQERQRIGARITELRRVVEWTDGLGIHRTRKKGFFAFLKAWRGKRRRFVTIDGQKARVLGPIGALETAVDITDLKCAEGDVAEFPIDSLFARGLPRTYQ